MKIKKEQLLRKDLSEQDDILKTIEETHTEFSKLLDLLKEECSNIIKDGPNKLRELQVLKLKLKEQEMKERMVGSIVKSSRILATGQAVTGKVLFPDMDRIRGMTLEQLTNLKIKKVQWYEGNICTLGLTLNDGQSCRAGSYDYNNNFDFPTEEKIVKVEVILNNGNWIGQINFYGKDGILKKLGRDIEATGAKESFLIGDNERLIGCELEHGKDTLLGVTFLKWTIA